jgi:hypothetical protein
VAIPFTIIATESILEEDALEDVREVIIPGFHTNLDTTPREMVPETQQRMLILVNGNHQFKIHKLPSGFGGRQQQATVTAEQLKEIVRRLALVRRRDICLHVLNGIQEG